MSNHDNHRRGHGKIQDNGPTWEGGPPSSGCNSTHVARSRRRWKRIGARAERRTKGKSLGGYFGKVPFGAKRLNVVDSEE
jgi:hypothetical protein